MSDKRQFVKDYRAIDRDRDSPSFGASFSYGRRFAQIIQDPSSTELTFYASRRDRIRKVVHIPIRSSILFVGGGFGFLQESFGLLGYSNMNSLDDSSYVNKALISQATLEIRRNFINASILEDVSSLGHWDLVVTDNIISTVPARDRRVFFTNCSLLGSKVIHLVVNQMDSRALGVKQWHREAPQHLWIDSRGIRLGDYGI